MEPSTTLKVTGITWGLALVVLLGHLPLAKVWRWCTWCSAWEQPRCIYEADSKVMNKKVISNENPLLNDCT
jgi:hypothetical protein